MKIISKRTIPIEFAVLERAIGHENCQLWMYMCSYLTDANITIHSYKHSIERGYLNVSEDMRAFKYQHDRFNEINYETAILSAKKQ